MQDIQQHRSVRSDMVSTLSPKAILDFEPAIDRCIDLFTREMSHRCGQQVDLEQWLQYWTGDVAAETALGRSVGFMEQGSDIRGIIQGLKTGFRYAACIGQVPACHPWLIGNRGLIKFLGRFMAVPDPPGEYIKMIEEAIEDDSTEVTRDVNNLLSRLQNELQFGKRKMNHTELIQYVFVFLAGGGTVSVTLGAVFYYLAQNRAAYVRLQNEIEELHSKGFLSAVPTHEQTLGVPYLEFVIKEAMRLCPISTLPLERIIPYGGLNIDQHHIPAGTKIGMATPTIHMNPSIYGHDAATFRPERWMDLDRTKVERMNKYFSGWSKGSRSCLGKHFAMLQIRKFVVRILRNFDIEWASEKPEWDLKFFWVTEQHGLHVRFRAKQQVQTAETEILGR